MKEIFDKKYIHCYMKGLIRNEIYDSLVLIITLAMSIFLFIDVINAKNYQYAICVLAAVKTFLMLNTKSKLKLYCRKFNEFHNEQ